uniref:Serine carboxypeptidase n=1 Tax=Acrobeloides nanus TaxID=290746 RepID=A0A914CVK2_9BILA
MLMDIWLDYQHISGPNCKKWDTTLTELNVNKCSELCMKLPKKRFYYNDFSRNTKTWMWQQCTEIGEIDVIDMCTIQFGPKYNETFVRNALNGLKQRYGTEKKFKATNLILTYGTYDLWSTSGYYETSNPTVYQIKVEGGLHCRVIDQSNNTKIQEAQEKIMNILEEWLKK